MSRLILAALVVVLVFTGFEGLRERYNRSRGHSRILDV
jgi:hypothetical protein